MTHQCSVKDVRSLKDALNLAAWLKDSKQSNLKERVGRRIGELAANSGSDKEGTAKQLFNSTLQNLSELREKIVEASEQNKYGIYSNTHHGNRHSDTDKCAENITATFVTVLPRLHATLNYMWTNVHNPTNIVGRGNWIKQKCNGPRTSSEAEETLFDFLTYNGEDYEDGYNTMLYGGYSENSREGSSELSTNKGSDLEEPLQKLLGTGIENASTASLRKLLDVLGLLSYDMTAVYLSAAAVLGTLGVGGAAAVATNFMGWGTALYALLGFA
ncbi:ribosome-binding protein 1 [Babesia caballi]|uniref:Ribosome-binding protein 1 n=1 Tax=Babesia caballi TaxID=5871 RepID=A0AAV4M1Q6_BABCB|nr:ribosome-binding protein 1 [Babesia caballi]